MELYTMRYVLAVAEHESFSLAAQACHVGQPALSQQVSRLEKELGVALFTRNSRGAVLTEAGREFVQMAQEIVQRADALQAKMSLFAGVRRGTLNLGIITSLQCIDFGGLLSAFCGSYPEVSVNITQDGTYRLFEKLLDRKLDAAFLNRPASGIPSGLEFVRLGEDVYSLAVPTIHPLAKRDQVSLEELRDEHFIFHQTGQVASELCLAACRKAGFEPNIVCRSASPTTGLYMVRGGLGVALLPSEEFEAHRLNGVLELKLKERIVKEVGIAWRKDTASPLVDTAVQFAREWAR
ncbi:LysR family transcriptional regulator [Pseudoflavonifractor sp. 60]|uniref:LysR family transcriptional regulator n=1 Tax=Pseudoflavonifractor sp. 60 TaxID=2304576 RepID=UPI0013685965|nr:LysR family transcriptional regulator [Pseudoflavonifractor sp. 60]NBI66368.1 LysR family transcriptional regulator [Pseudoflavonifractor sp. 60]